jgi:hypothetical protein
MTFFASSARTAAAHSVGNRFTDVLRKLQGHPRPIEVGGILLPPDRRFWSVLSEQLQCGRGLHEVSGRPFAPSEYGRQSHQQGRLRTCQHAEPRTWSSSRVALGQRQDDPHPCLAHRFRRLTGRGGDDFDRCDAANHVWLTILPFSGGRELAGAHPMMSLSTSGSASDRLQRRLAGVTGTVRAHTSRGRTTRGVSRAPVHAPAVGSNPADKLTCPSLDDSPSPGVKVHGPPSRHDMGPFENELASDGQCSPQRRDRVQAGDHALDIRGIIDPRYRRRPR